MRELTTAKIGTLLKITGQVVRTHPVHPELVTGTFICLDCQTVIKDVEQQFKYTQVCSEQVMHAARGSFMEVTVFGFLSLERKYTGFIFYFSRPYAEIQRAPTGQDLCWMSTNPSLLIFKKYEFKKPSPNCRGVPYLEGTF